MYDSTNPYDIPLSAEIVAGYIDGAYAWPAAGWDRFAGKPQVYIATSAATDDGTCLDVETGDATPAESVGWVERRRAKGYRPSVYMNAYTWSAVRRAFSAAGVVEPWYWVAQWDGSPILPEAATAKQYANPTLTGAHYDLSVVADYWDGVDNANVYTGYLGQTNTVISGASENLAAVEADVAAQSLANPTLFYEIRDPRGVLVKLYGPGVAPAPPPSPPPPLPPLDAARASWARLGDLFTVAFPDAVVRLEAAVRSLKSLP